MPPIGETLREARMRQGFDIADVEQRTKIRAKYLRALENEEWGTLPGHTFVKTFLRTYAEQVGLDPHLLVEEYRMSHEDNERDFQPLAGPPAAARRDSRRDTRRERRRSVPRRPPGWGAMLVAAAVTFVSFLLLLGLLGDDDGGGAADRASTEPTETERPPRKARRPRPPPPSGVAMRITPSVPTYACVDNGEETEVVFEGTLEGARTFRHRNRVRVNLGKRSVEIEVNGKPVPIEESPEPVGMEATEDGVKEILEGARPCA